MARSKNATALFEVIHTAKKPPKGSPTGGKIPAPKWWAKGAGKAADRPAADAGAEPEVTPEPTAGTRGSWLKAARRSAEPMDEQPSAEVPAEPSKVVITRIYPPGTPDRREVEAVDESPENDDADDAATPADESVHEPVEARPPERPSWAARRSEALAARAAVTASADPTFDPTADVSASDLRSPRGARWSEDDEPSPPPRQRHPRRSAGPTPSALKDANDSALQVDRTAGEVRFRLSYGGAIAAAVIVMVVILIAFLLGQSVGQRTAPSESAADATIAGRSTPAGVATATAGPAASSGLMAAASTPAPSADADHPAAEPAPAPAAAVAAAAAPPAPAVVAADTVPAEPPARQVGKMYVVVQSYPDRETAQRAGDFLSRSGVPCTVIPGLSGFALRDWYSVVGLQPFARGDHRPAVQTYLRQLTELGPKFSAKVYNQFQPQLYTWRADSDAPRP